MESSYCSITQFVHLNRNAGLLCFTRAAGQHWHGRNISRLDLHRALDYCNLRIQNTRLHNRWNLNQYCSESTMAVTPLPLPSRPCTGKSLCKIKKNQLVDPRLSRGALYSWVLFCVCGGVCFLLISINSNC